MENSILLLLNKSAPVNNIINAIVNGLDNKKVCVSANPDDHESSIDFPLNEGVAISYNSLSNRDHIFLIKLLYKIAARYSVKETNLKNGQQYNVIFLNDWTVSFLVPEVEWNSDLYSNVDDIGDFLVFTDPLTNARHIVPEEDIDELESNMNNDSSLATQCVYYDYTVVLDTPTYDVQEPSFFISAFFWRRIKVKFEKEAEDAFRGVALAAASLGLV